MRYDHMRSQPQFDVAMWKESIMQNMADQKWSDFSAVFNHVLYAFQIRQTVTMLLFEVEFHANFKPIGNPRSHLELTCEYKLYTLRNTKVSTPKSSRFCWAIYSFIVCFCLGHGFHERPNSLVTILSDSLVRRILSSCMLCHAYASIEILLQRGVTSPPLSLKSQAGPHVLVRSKLTVFGRIINKLCHTQQVWL